MQRAPVVLVSTSLAAFTATLDNTVVAVALRDMQRDLGAGVTGLQGVVTGYTVVLAALLLAGGAMVDSLGGRRVLLAGLTVFAAASAACAASTSVTALIACRVVQGGGAALLLPGGLAVLAAAYPDPVARRRAVGIWAGTGGLALVAGPVIGGLLVATYGWQAVFWINLPLVAAVTAVVLTTPSTPASGNRVDLAGAALTVVVLGSATVAVVMAGRHGFTGQVVVCLVVAAAGAVLLGLVESKAGALLPLSLLRERRLSGAAAGAFAAALAVFVLLVFISLFLQLVQDRSALRAGLLLLPLPLALVVIAPLAGRVRTTAAPVALGLMLAAGGLLALGATLGAATGGLHLGLLLAAVGAGVGLTTAPVVTAALDVAGAPRAGLAAATVNVARELGGVVAVAGLGALAVARLSARLGATLVAAGVSPGRRPVVLDALLGARRDEVGRLLLQDLGLGRTLALGSRLADVATASFVASTRLVLDGAGVVLLVAAASCAVLLRRHPTRGPRA